MISFSMDYDSDGSCKQSKAWMSANPGTHNKISDLIFAYNDIGCLSASETNDAPDKNDITEVENNARYILTGIDNPDTRNSQNTFNNLNFPDDPESINLSFYKESCDELSNSFRLAGASFYKYAFAALFNALESGLLSVILNKEDVDDEIQSKLLMSRKKGLFRKEIRRGLQRIDNIKRFCNDYDIVKMTENIHKDLLDLSKSNMVPSQYGSNAYSAHSEDKEERLGDGGKKSSSSSSESNAEQQYKKMNDNSDLSENNKGQLAGKKEDGSALTEKNEGQFNSEKEENFILSNYDKLVSDEHIDIPVVPGFNEETFVMWIRMLDHTVTLLLTLNVLKYPVSLLDTPIEKKFEHDSFCGPFLNTDQRELLMDVLDPNMLPDLRRISNNDNTAMEMAARINTYPNIIEEEFQQQLSGFKEALNKISTSSEKKHNPFKWLRRILFK